ncbi:low temperature requirement protein A [Microbispora siamensis]
MAAQLFRSHSLERTSADRGISRYWRGAAQTLLLLLAVWWAWIYTAWHTNWFDPDRPSVRIVLVAVMLASLVMSAALPRAFGEHGLMFAATYVAVQVVRTACSVAAAPRGPLRRNLARVLAWAVLSGAFWIAGGLAHGLPRELLWAAAVGTDLLAPWVGFVTPGLGRSATTDWSIDGAHLAERCQLFLILAFGESILVTGATFAAHPSPAAGTALLTAFGASVGLWWTYFGSSAEAGSRIWRGCSSSPPSGPSRRWCRPWHSRPAPPRPWRASPSVRPSPAAGSRRRARCAP